MPRSDHPIVPSLLSASPRAHSLSPSAASQLRPRHSGGPRSRLGWRCPQLRPLSLTLATKQCPMTPKTHHLSRALCRPPPSSGRESQRLSYCGNKASDSGRLPTPRTSDSHWRGPRTRHGSRWAETTLGGTPFLHGGRGDEAIRPSAFCSSWRPPPSGAPAPRSAVGGGHGPPRLPRSRLSCLRLPFLGMLVMTRSP